MAPSVRAILGSVGGALLASALACGGSKEGATEGSATEPAFGTYGCAQGELGERGAILATEGTTTGGGSEALTTGTTAIGDFEVMDACAIALACEPLWHQRVEAPSNHGTDEYLPEERCVLEGLRDGRPGAYRSVINPVWANGSVTETQILHVGLDRRVTVVVHRRETNSAGSGFPELLDEYASAKTCTLADPGFFSDCLAHYDDQTHLDDCLTPERWLRACGVSEPWCPCDP